jgi:hypothetical protein
MFKYSPRGTFRASLLEGENDINETEDPYGSLDEKSLYDESNKYSDTHVNTSADIVILCFIINKI